MNLNPFSKPEFQEQSSPFDIPIIPGSTSPFNSPAFSEAGAKYFMDITTTKEHRDPDAFNELKKRIRPEILNLNRLLYVHPALANLELESIQILRLSFDKKIMLVLMFLDRNSITVEEYDYITELKEQYYLMLTRAFGEKRERITQSTNTNVNLSGDASTLQPRRDSMWDFFSR